MGIVLQKSKQKVTKFDSLGGMAENLPSVSCPLIMLSPVSNGSNLFVHFYIEIFDKYVLKNLVSTESGIDSLTFS